MARDQISRQKIHLRKEEEKRLLNLEAELGSGTYSVCESMRYCGEPDSKPKRAFNGKSNLRRLLSQNGFGCAPGCEKEKRPVRNAAHDSYGGPSLGPVWIVVTSIKQTLFGSHCSWEKCLFRNSNRKAQ